MVESSFDYASLERQTEKYIKRTEETEFRYDRPPAVISAPLEVGLSRFIDVSNLPDISKLPKLPEYKRDFAFRYSTEYKQLSEWADIYGVGIRTIQKWLKDVDVTIWIAVTKLERRTWLYGQRLNLERKTFGMLNKLLDMRLTVDNAKEALDTVKFAHGVLDNKIKLPQQAPIPVSGMTTQVNINTGDIVKPETAMPQNCNGEAYTQDQIAEIKAETKYLEHLKDVMLEDKNVE